MTRGRAGVDLGVPLRCAGRSLQALDRRDPEAGPHPRTAEWEAAYSRALPGQTCAVQLEHVRRWYDTDQDWEQRLADALAAFHDCRWPLDLLRPGTAT